MPIENRSAEGCSLDRIAVASARAVSSCQYELERAGPRFSKQGYGIVLETSGVFLNVIKNLVDELGVVQALS